MIETNRRSFVLGLAAASATITSASAQAQTGASVLPAINSGTMATDATYWDAVRKLYAVSPSIVNLENGYWGIMAESVRLDYLAKTDMVNRENSFYARTQCER
jgi:hypothetical protein